jgi:alpha-galactosidase
MAPIWGMAADVRGKVDWALMKRSYAEWKRLRECMLGDYYPLTPFSLADDVWMAWQFDVPEKGKGVVEAFRRPGAMEASLTVKLRGLDPGASYRVDDLDAKGSRVLSGRELMEKGLRIERPATPASAIVCYRKTG